MIAPNKFLKLDGSEKFDRNSGNLLERLLFNYRRVVVIVCAVATVLLAISALQVRLNANFLKTVPSHHPFVVNFLQNAENLKGLGNAVRVAVAVTGEGTIIDAAYLDTLRQLNDELYVLPGVDRAFVKSLWTPATRWMGVTEEGFNGGTVMPDDYDGSPASLDAVRSNIERSGEIGQLVAPDFRSSIIYLPLMDINPETGEELDYGALNSLLETVRIKYEAKGVRLHITGFAKVMGDLIDALKQVLVFFAIAVIITIAILYYFTRCVRSTFLVLSCTLVAVTWLLGLLPLMGFTLDPYSILIPFLVFAIGISHGAQKMNGIMQDIGRGTDKLIAARYTFRRLFIAGVTALLADVTGFAVLSVIDIPAIRDLALIASLGVAILIVTNLALLPVLLSYTGVSARAAERSLKEESDTEESNGIWHFLDRFTQRRYALIACGAATVLGVVAFLVSLNIRVGDLEPGAPELRPTSRYNKDNDFIVKNYRASSDVFAVMVKTPPGQCAQFDTLRKVDDLEWKLRQLVGVEGTVSLAGLAKLTNAGMSEGSLKWYDLIANQGLINATAARAPQEVFNATCDFLGIYVFLKDHKADTLSAVVQAVKDFAAENDSTEAQFLLAAGNAGIEAATNEVVKDGNRTVAIGVYIAVIALCLIAFRSWRAVLCAVLPLVLTSALAEALMVLLGMGIKVATLPVIALGVGIGVDYALYILSVTLATLKQGESLSKAYYKALLFTGRVVVFTGFTLALGVMTWVFSPIKFQADMGILLTFMFVWNMVGALILIPALAHFLLPQPAFGNDAPKAVSQHGQVLHEVSAT